MGKERIKFKKQPKKSSIENSLYANSNFAKVSNFGKVLLFNSLEKNKRSIFINDEK